MNSADGSRMRISHITPMGSFIAGVAAVAVYMLPQIILWQNSYVMVLDNLDSPFVYRTVLVNSGQAFVPDSSIEQIMNGLPRPCLDSALSTVTWLFMTFKPFTAYIVDKLLVHFFAFTGMWLLLRKHFFPQDSDLTVVLGSSLCFAFLPFYAIFGLTVAGQPLLLYSLLNLYKKRWHWSDFAIIALFPFYSSLYQSGIFILLAAGVLCLVYVLNHRRANIALVIGAGVLALGYAVAEHNLIHLMFFDSDFVSHRTAWDPATSGYGALTAAKESTINSLFGQYHASSLHTLILIASVFVLTVALAHRGMPKDRNIRLLASFLLTAFAVSLFYGFFNWGALIPLKERFTILKMFNFSRINWFHPLLWYLVFALVLSFFVKFKWGKGIAVMLIALQLSYSAALSNILFRHFGVLNAQVMANETAINGGILVDRVAGREPCEISYRQFFSEPLFEEVADYIALPKSDYRIVNIGLHPSIAQYNGFYTLDSYQFNYPLEYKNEFRRIIAGELAKSEKWRKYFDGWGSRCYVFVAELENEPFAIKKDEQARIFNLSLNTEALKEMGGKYVFSAVEIVNAAENNLTLLRVFERSDSPWRIYLYGVNRLGTLQ